MNERLNVQLLSKTEQRIPDKAYTMHAAAAPTRLGWPAEPWRLFYPHPLPSQPMGQNPSEQNQQSSGSFSGGPWNPQAEQTRSLQAALAHASTNESNLKNEIETLKTSLIHALLSEREMRASARDTREEWERVERVERALRQEISALNKELADTKKELAKFKKELKGKKGIPFVQRLFRGQRSLIEEMVTLEEPPRNTYAKDKVEEECVSALPSWSLPLSKILNIHLGFWKAPQKCISYLMD